MLFAEQNYHRMRVSTPQKYHLHNVPDLHLHDYGGVFAVVVAATN
eukprot:COSAG06_NODE_668_length_13234_cov_75.848268_3_plen_45_part_00